MVTLLLLLLLVLLLVVCFLVLLDNSSVQQWGRCLQRPCGWGLQVTAMTTREAWLLAVAVWE